MSDLMANDMQRAVLRAAVDLMHDEVDDALPDLARGFIECLVYDPVQEAVEDEVVLCQSGEYASTDGIRIRLIELFIASTDNLTHWHGQSGIQDVTIVGLPAHEAVQDFAEVGVEGCAMSAVHEVVVLRGLLDDINAVVPLANDIRVDVGGDNVKEGFFYGSEGVERFVHSSSMSIVTQGRILLLSRTKRFRI